MHPNNRKGGKPIAGAWSKYNDPWHGRSTSNWVHYSSTPKHGHGPAGSNGNNTQPIPPTRSVGEAVNTPPGGANPASDTRLKHMMIFPGQVLASILGEKKGGFTIHSTAPLGNGGDDEFPLGGLGRSCPNGGLPEHVYVDTAAVKETLATGDWGKLIKYAFKGHKQTQPHLMISSVLIPMSCRIILLEFVEKCVQDVTQFLLEAGWDSDKLEEEHARLPNMQISLVPDSGQHHMTWVIWRLALPANAPQEMDTIKYNPGQKDLTSRWGAVMGSCHTVEFPFELQKYTSPAGSTEDAPWVKSGKPNLRIAVVETLAVQHGVLLQGPKERWEASGVTPMIASKFKKDKEDGPPKTEDGQTLVEFNLDVPSKKTTQVREQLLPPESPAHAIWENFGQEFMAEGASRGGKQGDRIRLRFPLIRASLLQETAMQERFRRPVRYCLDIADQPDFLFGRSYPAGALPTGMELIYLFGRSSTQRRNGTLPLPDEGKGLGTRRREVTP